MLHDDACACCCCSRDRYRTTRCADACSLHYALHRAPCCEYSCGMHVCACAVVCSGCRHATCRAMPIARTGAPRGEKEEGKGDRKGKAGRGRTRGRHRSRGHSIAIGHRAGPRPRGAHSADTDSELSPRPRSEPPHGTAAPSAPGVSLRNSLMSLMSDPSEM